MYDALDRDDEYIESVYDLSKHNVSQPKTVYLGGAEDLSGGTARELYHQLPNVNRQTIQVVAPHRLKQGKVGEPDDPLTEVFEYVNHASSDELISQIHRIAPIHTILMHGGDKVIKNEVNDCVVWEASGKSDVRTIYDDGWQGPPWFGRNTSDMILSKAWKKRASAHQPETDWPEIELELDLDDEAINVEKLHLSLGHENHGGEDSVDSAIGAVAQEPPAPAQGPNAGIEAQIGSAESGDGGTKYSVDSGSTPIPDVDTQVAQAQAEVIQITDDVVLLRPEEFPRDIRNGDVIDIIYNVTSENS